MKRSKRKGGEEREKSGGKPKTMINKHSGNTHKKKRRMKMEYKKAE